MKKLVLCAGLALQLAACANVTPTYGPDGGRAYALNCSGLMRSWNRCLEAAGEKCGARGYRVVSVNGDTGAVAIANPQGAFGASVIDRTMEVECRAAGAAR